jgi:hypothetical protein
METGGSLPHSQASSICPPPHRNAPRYVVFSTPLLLVPLRHIYLPQHPILEHPQTTFRPQCGSPSFTPIQNNRHQYSSVYFNSYISEQHTGRQRFLHRMTASIPWVQSTLDFPHECNFALLGCSQIFELFHPFEGLTAYLSVIFCPAFCLRDMNIYCT